MTAIFVLKQRSSIHIMTDAAAYDGNTGELHSVDLMKCIALPELHMAVAVSGPALLGNYLAERIADEFASFDEFVARGEAQLPDMFKEYAEENREGDALGIFYVAGWHRDRPAGFSMNLWTDDCGKLSQVTGNSSADCGVQRFKFEEIVLSGTPVPDSELIRAAGLRIGGVNDMRPELDLLHLMEIARHESIEGHFWVGGNAVLTTIDSKGISQRVVHHWTEDKVGETIQPLPIDWKAWRVAATIKAAGGIPAGLSRLQRERMERKALKGTLRAA